MDNKNASNGSEEPVVAWQSTYAIWYKKALGAVGTVANDHVAFSLIALVLVSASSFALGRLSIAEQYREPVRIEYSQDATVAKALISTKTPEAILGGVVASKSGSVYYFPWCAGALKIAEANKVWYATEGQAKAVGLRPAANCKGMTGR
ncbi:MAG: hypothetical protein AAB447_03455 [Patescibacteria group bacterium]